VAAMSWVAHDVEPYVLKLHMARFEAKFGFGVSFLAILIGSWFPDMATKWIVYGTTIGPWKFDVADAASFHRSWPGVGFTHSLAYGVAVGVLFWLVFRRHRWAKTWAIGLLVGVTAHVLSDTLDTNGVMLFFPFSTERVSLEVWAYAGSTGRYADGAAYFSSLGFVWDGFWITMVLLNWKTLRFGYFQQHVMTDPFFGFLNGRLRIPETALVVVYRAAFFYGVCRWLGWLLWTHVGNSYAFDLSLGGPDWIPPFETLLVLFGISGCACHLRH
jgi:membrane-bound metal-dependent hydrolase YbcI (DUF457 family)